MPFNKKPQHAASLYHIRVRALEMVQSKGDNFHKSVEGNNQRLDQDTEEFANALAVVVGLLMFSELTGITVRCANITQKQLGTSLNYFARELAFQAAEASDNNDIYNWSNLEETRKFVFRLLAEHTHVTTVNQTLSFFQDAPSWEQLSSDSNTVVSGVDDEHLKSVPDMKFFDNSSTPRPA